MARPNKRKQLMRELAKQRNKKRNLKDSDSKVIQEEHGWESSEVEEDVTAIGLLQQSAGAESDESEDELEDVLPYYLG